MARVALLVTVLAALCYTSQAIPVPIENAEDTQPELPNIIQQIFDQFAQRSERRIQEMEGRDQGMDRKIRKRAPARENIRREQFRPSYRGCREIITREETRSKRNYRETQEKERKNLRRLPVCAG